MSYVIRIRHHVQNHPGLGLLDKLRRLQLRQAPGFLGDFQYQMYDNLAATGLPEVISAEFNKLAALVPGQQFNTWFIQRYDPGQGVKPHRDPRSNIGATVIGLYGNDWETRLDVEEPNEYAPPQVVKTLHYKQYPGDVFILPCTINGVQGPRHSVSWPQVPDFDLQGTRWVLICNTILRH